MRLKFWGSDLTCYITYRLKMLHYCYSYAEIKNKYRIIVQLINIKNLKNQLSLTKKRIHIRKFGLRSDEKNTDPLISHCCKLLQKWIKQYLLRSMRQVDKIPPIRVGEQANAQINYHTWLTVETWLHRDWW